MVQVQLNKIFYILQQNNMQAGQIAPTTIPTVVDEKVALGGITFPINTLNEIELLERQLADEEYERDLIACFTKVCGNKGNLKLSKIGLLVVGAMFTDNVLSQVTWKGNRTCPKMPFSRFFKIRAVIYKILKLADSTCSLQEVDRFIQNSAIKHSAQRAKRKSSTQMKSTQRKTNTEHDSKKDHTFEKKGDKRRPCAWCYKRLRSTFNRTFIVTNHGTTLFQYNGYTYWKTNYINQRSGTVRWYCSSRTRHGCPVVLTCCHTRIVCRSGLHNHDVPMMQVDSYGRYYKMKNT
ncbi:uncharacterized protein LOC125235028 [Leguminivora glycinivorella]|uniref:uncharacterized protein LOC125235028 n=1 Tax=Leguminivora glycinivorella TaxID=1035111 RepID=UPI00200FA631|nr:uncharacterized protein LOC125235028 [Leguminivora glycinivorella]